MILTIRTFESLAEFPSAPPVRLVLQRKDQWLDPVEGSFKVELKLTDTGWRGPEVVRHGDKRAFIYLAWLRPAGDEWAMCARIKLYLDQIPDLGPDRDSVVTIRTVTAKGQLACSTAVLVI